MKNRKILYLFPLVGLILSGCNFQEGVAKAKSYLSGNVYHPVKDFLDGLSGKSNEEEKPQEEKKQEEEQKPQDVQPNPDTPEEPKVEPKVYLGKEVEAFFWEFEHVVEVPDYKSYDEKSYVSVDDSYSTIGVLNVIIENSTREEMLTYVADLEKCGWTLKADEDGDYEGQFGENTNASVLLFDYTNPEYLEENEDPYIGLSFLATEAEDGLQHIKLDCLSEIYEKDEGVIHQVNQGGYKIDLLGYKDEGDNALGSIKTDEYGKYTYNGMIYNRSLIDNLKSIRVNFSGGKLYYKFTNFLMEDMNFDGENEIESGVRLEAPEGSAYFVLYTLGEEKVTIRSLDVTRDPNGLADYKMIFDKSYESTMGGARSNAKSAVLENDLIELENNPTEYTNNYSGSGKHNGHTNADSWYRWNGRYFAKSENLGTDFTFSMTIIGDYSRMIDDSKFFHYNVWPQFAYENCFTSQGGQENSSYTYAQTYIGNDNYEPLGSENALNPSDPYVAESYAGRFFTDYGWYNNDWQFADPDLITIEGDNNVTMRQAYEKYNLPFWNLEFHVFLDKDGTYAWEGEDPQPVCQISINGMLLYTYTIFEHYDMSAEKDIFINTMPMHLVNYGVKLEGSDEYETYKGSFTYPRLVD